MDFSAGEVGSGSEIGVADYVEVGESGESERLTESAAAGTFDVDDEVGVVAKVVMCLQAGKERCDVGDFVFAASAEAIGSFIR